MKTCTICGDTKELQEFLKDKNANGGYRNQCKQCLRERNKDVWSNRKEQYNASMRKFRNTWKGATATSHQAAYTRSKQQNVPFSITLEYVRDLLEKQNYLCALTGDQLVLKGGWNSPSLDKINPSLGYIEGNVQWLTKRVNLIKSNMDNKELLDFCRKCLERSETIPLGEYTQASGSACPVKRR